MLEDLIVASDRRNAPVTVGMIARTRDAVDVSSLRDAVRAILIGNPMARARIRSGLLRRWWWFPETVDECPLTVAGGGDEHDLWEAFAALCSQPLPLASAPPLRVLHMSLPEGDAVALAVHHVAMDGVSVSTLLRAILARCSTAVRAGMGAAADGYADHGGPAGLHVQVPPAGVVPASRLSSQPPRRDPIASPHDGPRLPHGHQASRESHGRRGRGRLSGPAVLRQALPARVASRSVLGGSQPSDAGGTSSYGLHCLAVPIPRVVVALPGGVSATVNDLLLAATQLAVERWNTAAGRTTGQVRVRMPVSLRTRAEASAIGNRTGEVQIITSARERRDNRTLLTAVCRQTAAGKASGAEPDTWTDTRTVGGALASRIPAPARHAFLRLAATVARPLLMPTTSVTNLGYVADPTRTGSGRPRIGALHFAAFAGPPQGLVIAAVGYINTLYISFCYHHKLFDRPSAVRFAELFQTALGELSR